MLSVRSRLSVMMFLEYFIWGSWAVQIGSYMDGTLHFEKAQSGSIYSTTAIAAMVSPLLMGYVADRLMATEKLLALLHFLGAGLLAWAAVTEDFAKLFPIMIGYALLFMPTLALTNSISFGNIASPDKDFPRIRVFGTFGWIVAGWVVGFVLCAAPGTAVHSAITKALGSNSPILASNNFIFLAAISSLVMSALCLTLPHTPPQGKSAAAAGDRKSVLTLLAEPSFLVFVVASFLICIPLAFYYNLANVFLTQIDAPYPTALQTIGQISEIFFMAMMPFFIVRLGVKKMLAVGMLAWAVRYFCFGTYNVPLIVFGLVLHGICYDFFFVGSQIYVDSKVDVRQRASAQSFLAFVTLGVAMYIGAMLAWYTMGNYPPKIMVNASSASGKTITVALPNWDPTGEKGFAKEMALGEKTKLAIDQFPASFTEDKVTYQGAALAETLTKAGIAKDGQVTREEWRLAQRNDWFHIWLWPALAAVGTLVLFLVGFHDKSARAKTAH